MSRKAKVTAAIVFAVLVSGFWLLASRSEPGVTLHNFRQLHAGMKWEEVEAIMGQPGDWSKSGFYAPIVIWTGEEGMVMIGVGPDHLMGMFVIKDEPVAEIAPAPKGLFVMVRQWLRF